jgi:hypothetical protein
MPQSILDLKSQLDLDEWRRVVILGSGISLLNLPKSIMPSLKTVALNRAIEYAGADIHFYADDGLNHEFSRLDPALCRYVVTSHKNAKYLSRVPGYHVEKLHEFTKEVQGDMHKCTPENDALWVCQTCATAAIMLCAKLGVKEVYLVGVDTFKIEYRHPEAGHYFANYYSDRIESGGMFVRIPCHSLMAEEIDTQLKWMRDTWPSPPTIYQTNPLGGTKFTPFYPLGRLIEESNSVGGSPIRTAIPQVTGPKPTLL